jgi:flagellar biosynthesis protein FlgN
LKQASNPALDRAWTDFQKQLIQAKELNRLNGILINKQFQRNQERLNALQGQADSTQVYGKNGQAQGAGGSRTSMMV